MAQLHATEDSLAMRRRIASKAARMIAAPQAPARYILTTIWSVDTAEGHSVEIRHPMIEVADVHAAAAACARIDDVHLHPGGVLTYRQDGLVILAGTREVTIAVYTRPMPERGDRFIPDPTTAAGRSKISATFADPAYNAEPGEIASVPLSMAGLAAIPGAIGPLGSIAYDLAERGSPNYSRRPGAEDSRAG